jgi:hypothetical protein
VASRREQLERESLGQLAECRIPRFKAGAVLSGRGGAGAPMSGVQAEGENGRGNICEYRGRKNRF